MFIFFKYLITSFIIVVASEVAKKYDKIGAIITSLPLITILTLIWLNYENQNPEKIKNHAYYTFWYVIPTLPMFLLFPYLYDKFGFYKSLLISCIFTIIIFFIFGFLLKKFNINII